jgi:hypothetical protein
MAEISPEMMAKFKTFRKARQRERGGRAIQALGGAGGAWRGDGGAAFERLDPRRKYEEELEEFYERQREKSGLVSKLAEEEHYYFGKEQQERQALMSDIMSEIERISGIAKADAQLSATAQQAKARLQGGAQWDLALQAARDLKDMQGLDPTAAAFVDQLSREHGLPSRQSRRASEDKATGEAILAEFQKVANTSPESRARYEELKKQGYIVTDVDGGDTIPPGMRASDFAAEVGIEREELPKYRAAGAAEAAKTTRAQMQAQGVDPTAAMADSLRALANSDMTYTQKHNAMISLAGGEEELHAILGRDPNGFEVWDTIKQARGSEITLAEEKFRKESETAIETMGRTHGGRVEQYLGELPSLLERHAQATEMAKETSPLQGQDFDMDGIPDIDWAPSAEGQFQQILDHIAQYPTAPPMQHAKSQIMGSPEFKAFQEQYGYSDPDFAFREMNRLTRAKQRENRRSSRQMRKDNLRAGVGAYSSMARPGPTPTGPVTQDTAGPKKKPTEDLVSGAAGSRIAEN